MTERPEKWTDPWIWVHGIPARDIATIVAYLNSDDHDRSKVEFYDGKNFYPLEIIGDSAP